MSQSQQGQLIQADFFDNTGGLNLTDSPFRAPDSQATGGYNYDYALTGGIRKRDGHGKLNSSADTQLLTLGMGVHIDSSNTKTAIRAAGRKIQSFNTTSYAFTNLSEDTATAGTDFYANASTQQVVFNQFSTPTTNVLWTSGGGLSALYGAYSSSKITKNGVAEPGGSISLSAGGSGGVFAGTGYYRYGVALRKTSTQAISNVVLFKEVNVTATTQKVTITLSSITGIDTTKHDKIYIYRSASSVGSQGNVAFTTGDLVTTVDSTTSSYVDDGTYSATSQNVPQAGNTVLDNSVLPSGTYNALATFKRRLVTATGSTVYLSDLNKPESWPTANVITVPSGGPITGLAVLSFVTPTSSSIDEILVIFKERELWVITGSSLSDWSLKFIDAVGCPAQNLVVTANGYMAWIDYRGIYLWDGNGKPIYCSRPIEALFANGGDLDKVRLARGWGAFYRKTNQIIWFVSHIVKGTQQYSIKLDLRLTLPGITTTLAGRIADGVFIQDSLPFALYGGTNYLPTTFEEFFLAGDDSGYIYSLYSTFGDASSGVDFSYETKFFDLGKFGSTKRLHKVIVWTQDSTDADLTLDWWAGYKSDEDGKGSVSQPASKRVSEALWDLAYWDSAYYDATVSAYNAVVFNINTQSGASEGDCFKLRFRQSDANAPVVIAGFSIIYTDLGMRK